MFKSALFLYRHVIMAKTTRILLLASFLVLSVSLAAAPHAFAASANGPSPNYVTVQCLEESGYITESGDNSADGYGDSYNNCLASLTIVQVIRITSSCPGLGNGTGVINTSGSTSVGVAYNQSFTANAGCVVCNYTDGILTGESHPNFTLLETVTATGSFTYRNVVYHATSDTASESTPITNTGKYSPSCPATD